MAIYMELTVENLRTLKDLGFELSTVAKDTMLLAHSCWGKYIAIVFGRVLIGSGDRPSYQLTPISKASEILTLFNLGMTEELIIITLRGDQHVVLTPNLN